MTEASSTRIPAFMRAVRLTPSATSTPDRPDTLALTSNAPVPTPAPDQALLRVLTTSITANELSWAETLRRQAPIPGHDVCGLIVSMPTLTDKQESGPSSATPSFQVGDKVFALTSFSRDGAAAEYVVASPTELALAPEGRISDEEIASLPLSALTAWQALFEHAGLQSNVGAQNERTDRAQSKGEAAREEAKEQARETPLRILITAASGGVGSVAVQLAKRAVAGDTYVIGTCSARNVDFVRGLGADEVVDYTVGTPSFEDAVLRSGGPVDVALDCVGGATLSRCWACLKSEGGVVVSVAEPPSEVNVANNPGKKGVFFVVKPNGTQLAQIASLVERGAIKGVVDSVWDLSEAVKAFDKLGQGHARGKIVLRIGTGRYGG